MYGIYEVTPNQFDTLVQVVIGTYEDARRISYAWNNASNDKAYYCQEIKD